MIFHFSVGFQGVIQKVFWEEVVRRSAIMTNQAPIKSSWDLYKNILFYVGEQKILSKVILYFLGY